MDMNNSLLLKMQKNKIWLSAPHMGGKEQQYIQEAFDTNWIAPIGPNIDFFEQSLEHYLGLRYVAALNSGTAAIHLGLILLGVKSGDTVLCQSLTFSASANPILYQGAIPIFIDSEAETWNLCPVALEEAIIDQMKKGKKPKAIIAVHLYGIPYLIDAIRVLADTYGIPILEDSAEALGSSYKGQKCGTFGDVGIFSFNGSKIITTSGGGAIVTNSEASKKKAIFYATQSRDDTIHYQHSQIGYTYRMSNVCAGIGRGQMEVLEKHLESRRAIHQFYTALFEGIDGITVHAVPDDRYFSNCWLTAILINPVNPYQMKRDQVMHALSQENIESRPLWKPMHLQPLFKENAYYGDEVAATLFEHGLCLPSGSNLSNEELNRIKGVFLQLMSLG